MQLSAPATFARLRKLVFIFATLLATTAFANPMTIKRTTHINEVGDATMEMEIKLNAMLYNTCKANMPNFSTLLRNLGVGSSWKDMEDINGKFNDMERCIEISYKEPGFARVVGDGRWVIPFAKNSELEELLVSSEQSIFSAATQTPFGVGVAVEKIFTPPGSSAVKFDSRRNRLEYHKSVAVGGGDNAEVDFLFDSKSRIMSCLAKCYADEDFNDMWAARSVVKNTGSQTLKDFRVRFRINEFSPWSSWKRSKRVYPGQTLVDAFYPVLDLDKIAGMNGTRHAMLEVEYEYRTDDGELIKETDATRVEMLARNEAVFSNMRGEDQAGFHDLFSNIPALMAAYVSGTDPVMQQLAGGVCGMADGISAASSDENALLFMKAMHAFVTINEVHYQTPPNFLTSGINGQHVKYGRDVIRNRAATCVDSAILWGSAFEAVGLDPIIVVIPGHAFPAVRLPESGRIIAIESTMVSTASFDASVEQGMETMKKVQESNTPHYIVDINELRQNGIQPLDLEKVKDTYLKDLGYTFKLPQAAPQPQPERQPQAETTSQNRPTPSDDQAKGDHPNRPSVLFGTWKCNHKLQNGIVVEIIAYFGADGVYASANRVMIPGEGTSKDQEEGVWWVESSTLYTQVDNETTSFPLEIDNDGRLWVQFETLGTKIPFKRTQI